MPWGWKNGIQRGLLQGYLCCCFHCIDDAGSDFYSDYQMESILTMYSSTGMYIFCKISLNHPAYSLRPLPPFSGEMGGNAVAKQGPDSCRGRGNGIAETGLYFPFIVVMSLPTMEAQGHSVLFKGVLDFQADQDHNRIYLCLVIDSGSPSQQNKRLEPNRRLLLPHLLSHFLPPPCPSTTSSSFLLPVFSENFFLSSCGIGVSL